ncbi:TetR/AcrR family transcriptional regulator [Gordonia sp. TBRC 11910]|uniref:TetR/AcrR family transcriptional regulator n=1 Tax=Gordonia asplenii TaxID=2725283 RepID=A0A848KXB2_9ACTN|nr:TetR/AcrR family transcriptional regulator [Gordonia asplenii]NMO03424.1 TetR/AcrR family transcriptional regulator [Gordonia asplenii]
MTTTTAPRKRPGGRSARVRDTVYRAVGTLVSEGHRETMTIPQVAEAAGVNATSIYRRWGTIDVLLEEVAVAALTRDEPLPDTGTLVGDLSEWAAIIAADITQPHRRSYLRAMVAARDGIVEGCPCWAIRTTQAAEMIDRAEQRGEATPQVRQVLDHVIAPLYHHAVFGLPIDEAYARLLVSDVLTMGR